MLYNLGATNITSNVDATSTSEDTNNGISLTTVIVLGIVFSILYKMVSSKR